MNQWRNTKSVTELFKAIKNKSKSYFIKFDIVEFKGLLSKPIEYIQTVTTIEEML